LARALYLAENYDKIIESQALSLVENPDQLDPQVKAGLIGWFESILIDEDLTDFTDIVDDIRGDPAFYYRHNLTLEKALSFADIVMRAENKFVLQTKSHSTYKNENAGILMNLGKVTKGVRSSYFKYPWE